MKPLTLLLIIVCSVVAIACLIGLVFYTTKWSHQIAVKKARLVGFVLGLCGSGWLAYYYGFHVIRRFFVP